MTVIELKQRHVDAFYSHLPEGEMVGRMFIDLLRNAGAIVRAAQKANWLDPDPGNVDELKPSAVLELAKAVAEAYGKAITIDPS